MRNVEGKLWMFLAATAAAGAAVAVSARADYLGQWGGAAPAVTGVGVALLVILLIVDIIFWKLAHATRRARRPDQRIAAWHVSTEDWAAYFAADAARAKQVPTYIHAYKPRSKVPARGVDVLAARSGMIVDDVYIELEPRGLGAMTGLQWLTGRPECIEFSILVPRGGPSNSIRSEPGLLRVPVSAAGREEGVNAFTYYRSRLEADELANPVLQRTMVRICVALATIGLPLGALGFWMNANGVMEGQLLPALLALLGTMGGGAAALVALIVWAVMLRKRR